ncbi:MAG: carbon-nitrogen hydrolase family protein [Rhizobiales bacterium]|nr:carbon-nitrogen hydrolase family protein [Hyphomicrobiales bacterium]
MARTVRIATTSLATLEDTAPPYNLRHPDPADTLALGLSLLDAAGSQGADLVCLPEGFIAAGMPGSRIREIAEPLTGPSMSAVAERAKRHGMYVVAGSYARIGERVFNVAALFDRSGRLVGTYAKRHPTEGEIDCGVVAGSDLPVFETDFGRVGLAICFDLNWRGLWDELKSKGAEFVCWISAYEGGFPLQAYAWLHGVTIISSVWPYHGRIIERSGRVLTQTSRWGRVATADINVDKRWFHTDGQMQAILAIQDHYGKRVRIETYGEEHIFTVESADPGLGEQEIVERFALVDYDTYVARCTAAQGRSVSENARRVKAPEPVG